MKSIISRLFGHDDEVIRLEAQRDSNRALAVSYARQAQNLQTTLNMVLADREQAATLAREAHRQLNLRHSTTSAQGKILTVARILEGKDPQ